MQKKLRKPPKTVNMHENSAMNEGCSAMRLRQTGLIFHVSKK